MNPTFSTLNWYGMVVDAWGEEWGRPEVAYEFSSGRRFYDGRGIYA